MTVNIQRSLNTRITFFANTANLLIVSLQSLIMTPIYIKAFGTVKYGAWLGTGDFLLWLQAMDFGISNFAIQKMSAAHGRKDSRELMSWFLTTLLLLLLLGFIATVIALFLSLVVFGPFHLSQKELGELQSAFRTAGISLGLTLVTFAFVGLGRSIQEPWWINGFTILGSLVGFLVTYTSLKSGGGINAIANGMLTRSTILFFGGLGLLINSLRYFENTIKLPEKKYFKESMAIIPFSTIGSVSYALGNQSENALISYLISPHIAATYNTMKKLGDMGRSLLESLTYSSFAPFSSEYAEKGSGSVVSYQKILNTNGLLAVLLCFFLILFNKVFLDFWVNKEIYLGHTFNILIALQIYSSTRSYLMNSLNRAIESPKRAYTLLFFESSMKITFIIVSFHGLGIQAVPLAASLSALISIIYFHKRHKYLLKASDQTSLALFGVISILAIFSFNIIFGSIILMLVIFYILIFVYERKSKSRARS